MNKILEQYLKDLIKEGVALDVYSESFFNKNPLLDSSKSPSKEIKFTKSIFNSYKRIGDYKDATNHLFILYFNKFSKEQKFILLKYCVQLRKLWDKKRRNFKIAEPTMIIFNLKVKDFICIGIDLNEKFFAVDSYNKDYQVFSKNLFNELDYGNVIEEICEAVEFYGKGKNTYSLKHKKAIKIFKFYFPRINDSFSENFHENDKYFFKV